VLAAALAVGGFAGFAWYWTQQPVTMGADRVQYVVQPGIGVRRVAQAMQEAGIDVQPDAFVGLARFTGMEQQIDAGPHEAQSGVATQRLLERMERCDLMQARITFVEGWT